MTDNRLFAPAVTRNRDSILAVLRGVLPDSGRVLEIASGSGEHVVHFARALPGLTFQPSDPDPQAVQSIAAWVFDAKLTNIDTPRLFDVIQPWPFRDLAAIVCINMIHIAPWRAVEALFRGAASALSGGAPLYLYGPYRRANTPTAPTNEAFDASLRARNPEWGLRNLEAVVALAQSYDFATPAIAEMPANNLSVIFRRR